MKIRNCEVFLYNEDFVVVVVVVNIYLFVGRTES